MMLFASMSCNSSMFSCCLAWVTSPNSACSLAPSSRCNERKRDQGGLLLKINRTIPFGRGLFVKNGRMKNAIYASCGDMADDLSGVFPRIHVRDPYKRLGISKEASGEEIQSARNFLINKYIDHKRSIDAIESAHDKIIMQSLYDRKTPKINLKKKVRAVTQSRYVKAITSRFQTPSTHIILKASIAFLMLGVLTFLFPTEEGPTLQVAISLMLSIYFIHERLKSRMRACFYGIGAFFFSWMLGTFLMVSVMPPLLKGPISLEVTTSLLSYVFLCISSIYLK